jgi:histidyl-tRNA synthetase
MTQIKSIKPRRASGFGEYLPSEQIEFDRLLNIIRSTYEKYGFSPLDTPDLELSEVLLAKGGGETEQQVYRFTKGKNDLTLRYDLTVPLARYAAEHESDLVFPFRRYHIGKVHRAERAQKGRFREFYQCDIDMIGSNSPVIDAEFPAVINEIFDKFGFGEFTIRLNNRMILNGFFEGIGLVEESRDVLRTIDKMEKISAEELVAELSNIGLNTEQVEQVLSFTAISGSNDEVLTALSAFDVQSPLFKEGIERLRVLIDALRTMEVPESRFKIDLKIARGLDYYTGTVYETILNDYPEVGSVCSGGRYDDLAEYYTKTKLPGVGISIGLTRLFSKLREVPGLIQTTRQSPADVVVMPIAEDQVAYSISVAATLRKAGIPTMLYTETDALNKKLRFADRMGFTHVIIIGETEVAQNVVSLKNMVTGDSSAETVDRVLQIVSGQQ